MLMTGHNPDLGSASDWSCRARNLIQPIRNTTQILVVTRHQYEISALVSQTSFREETSGNVAKCRPFSQAKPDRPTQFFLITNSSTGMQHLICDVGYICGSFYFDLKTPVMKLTSTIRKDKKERQERCKVLKDQAKKSRQNCDQLRSGALPCSS